MLHPSSISKVSDIINGEPPFQSLLTLYFDDSIQRINYPSTSQQQGERWIGNWCDHVWYLLAVQLPLNRRWYWTDLSGKFLLNSVKVVPVIISDEIDCEAEMPKSTSAPNSMKVRLSCFGEVKIYHHIHRLNINTSSEQIWGKHQNEKSVSKNYHFVCLFDLRKLSAWWHPGGTHGTHGFDGLAAFLRGYRSTNIPTQ